eukprot:gene18099-19908_t
MAARHNDKDEQAVTVVYVRKNEAIEHDDEDYELIAVRPEPFPKYDTKRSKEPTEHDEVVMAHPSEEVDNIEGAQQIAVELFTSKQAVYTLSKEG